jgi:MFS family permease
MALLSDSVDQGRIGQAMGCMSVAGPLASLCAPVLGGFVFDHSGYYAVFAMGFAIIGLDGILRVTMMERKACEKIKKPRQPFHHNDHGDLKASPLPVTGLGPCPPSLEKDDGSSESVSETDKVVVPEQERRLPCILLLLRSPRLLAALWGTTIQQGLMTSFQSVSLRTLICISGSH